MAKKDAEVGLPRRWPYWRAAWQRRAGRILFAAAIRRQQLEGSMERLKFGLCSRPLLVRTFVWMGPQRLPEVSLRSACDEGLREGACDGVG